MLRAVASVRDAVLKRANGGSITLEMIGPVFTGLTIVDEIIYVCYDTPPDNPIWGEFCRWSRRPSVYASMETIVEIRYAAHLSEAWRRFVVCKELCHSLETVEGCHDASASSIDYLVTAFSLRSHEKTADTSFLPFQSEILAEAAAVELLCPLAMRKEILASTTSPDATTLARRFNIPTEYAKKAVDPAYNEAIEWLLANAS